MLDRLRRRDSPLIYWLLAGLSFAGYAILLSRMPLAPAARAGTLADINTFTPWPWGTLGYVLLLATLFTLYWLAYRWVAARPHPPTLPAILLPALAFSALLIPTYPFNATDIYRYVLWGRMLAFHGLNPYLVPLEDSPDRSAERFAGEWGSDTSPYGPAWQVPSAAVARVSGEDLLLNLLLFKLLAVACFMLSAIVLWLLWSRSRGDARVRASRTLLWAWNPALLLIFAADGHNDSLMILWWVLGLWIVQRDRPAVGLIVMGLAALTKASGLLPLPFVLAAVLRDLPDARHRLRLLAIVAAGLLTVALAAFLPFGSPVDLVLRLLREATGGGGYSPLAMLILAGEALGVTVPLQPVLVASGLGLMAVFLAVLWRTWRGGSSLAAAVDILAAYLALALQFRIWYAAWPFPWALLHPHLDSSAHAPLPGRLDFRLRASLWFLLTTQLSVVIYGRLRLALLGESMALAHVLGVLLTFGLPLLLAALGHPRGPTPAPPSLPPLNDPPL